MLNMRVQGTRNRRVPLTRGVMRGIYENDDTPDFDISVSCVLAPTDVGKC
jgi:hypothetical protein